MGKWASAHLSEALALEIRLGVEADYKTSKYICPKSNRSRSALRFHGRVLDKANLSFEGTPVAS